MKKIASILIAVLMMAAMLFTVAVADEAAQPEGGKKFEGKWAIAGITADVVYEEEGYRVLIHAYDEEEKKGTNWEYNCFYDEASDSLKSISSSRTDFTIDAETLDLAYGEPAYDDMDEDNNVSSFTVNADASVLYWADGHENAGADLEFVNVGKFQGVWRNEAEDIFVEIDWNGQNHDSFFYTVFLHRGGDENTYTEFNMQGVYNLETKKLECKGAATTWNKNAEGGFDPTEDPEEYEAFFSLQDNGKLLFEAENGIELEYDIMGSASNTAE